MNVTFADNINNYPSKMHDSINRNNYVLNNAINTQSFGAGLDKFVENSATKLATNPNVQKLLTGKGFNKILKMATENPGLYEALVALVITCSLRPMTILATPGAKMEDKQYASAQSVASGVTGLLFAYALFDPIKEGLDNILVDVNGKNIKNVFKGFYENPQNKKLIDQLVSLKIIPTPEDFKTQLADEKNNIFKYMKDYLKDMRKAKNNPLDAILTGSDVAKQQEWADLAEKYSKALGASFKNSKNTGVESAKKYLIHDSLKFVKEGAYKLKPSTAADKMKFILNYSCKILFFPLTAAVTIWAIPKIMKLIFPNHRKSKKASANNKQTVIVQTSENLQDKYKNLHSADKVNMSTFKQFQQKPANMNKQVSFSGKLSFISPMKIYEKGYKKPLASIFEKIFSKITYSSIFSNKMEKLLQNDVVQKHGMNVINRNAAGKILKKYDTNAFIGNLPEIAAVSGTCLYILNTIQNKEIEPERKPALCTNMALVAIFSFFAGKAIKKFTTPIFDALKKTHIKLMGNNLNYDIDGAWRCAKDLLTTTFAFRYLGPVLATPAADKVLKLFGKDKSGNQIKTQK